MESKKPPIGLTPRYVYKQKMKEQRISDIIAAIQRYEESNLEVNNEWIEELCELLKCDIPDKIKEKQHRFAILDFPPLLVQLEHQKFVKDFQKEESPEFIAHKKKMEKSKSRIEERIYKSIANNMSDDEWRQFKENVDRERLNKMQYRVILQYSDLVELCNLRNLINSNMPITGKSKSEKVEYLQNLVSRIERGKISMVDVSKCDGTDCPLKEKCYRYTSKSGEINQSYIVAPFTIQDNKFNCDLFMGDRSLSVVTQLTEIIK